MNKHSVAPVFEFSNDDLVDIISSAVYDIGYWACINNNTESWDKMSNSLTPDHTFEDVMFELMKSGDGVDILDVEGTDGPWNLTLDKLLNGIKLTIEHGFWNGKLDDIDGEVGDIIFQYSLFNEIVYG
jgi:hypothetical protein